ncbi:hypothetical protein EZI54_06815 [Marinobacter halodurans]|uniref:Peptidase S8/S53 domain-containing protein n=1 Tax=Marinobacter halodurans TaxID=2528979 RepID=A0ABY1ZM79_9GAMM|nr:S8 family serine peptidase [Marinobacter halodurans]TBW57362.1 hypothetical protein EZI54_06815 [Marinobacter halodurans]
MKRIILTSIITAAASSAMAAERAEIIVEVAPGADNIAAQVDFAEPVQDWGSTEVVSVDAGSVEASIKLLRQLDDVISAEPNETVNAPTPPEQPLHLNRVMSVTSSSETVDAMFNDPLFSRQYAWETYNAQNPGASSVSHAVGVSVPYRPLTVAVLDNGFTDTSSFNWAGGYNFATSSNSHSLPIGPDFYAKDINFEGVHGQEVASVIGGAQNDGLGNAGVLGNATFYASRVLGVDPASNTTAVLVNGLKWAIGEPVTNPDTGSAIPPIPEIPDIVNMSLGNDSQTSCPAALQSAIDTAHSKGILVVVAAGNTDGTGTLQLTYPASCNNVLVVGATDQQGAAASFSKSGAAIDLSAAGQDIPVYSSAGGNQVNGTSFSAPLAAGIIGNLWQDIPGFTADELTSLATGAVNPLTSGTNMGTGILDASKLQEDAIASIDPPDFELRHPLEGIVGAQDMLAFLDRGGANYGHKREVRINTSMAGKKAVVFQTDDTQSIASGGTTAIQGASGPRFLVDSWDSAKQYGIQKCSSVSGTGCSANTLVPLDMPGASL